MLSAVNRKAHSATSACTQCHTPDPDEYVCGPLKGAQFQFVVWHPGPSQDLVHACIRKETFASAQKH